MNRPPCARHGWCALVAGTMPEGKPAAATPPSCRRSAAPPATARGRSDDGRGWVRLRNRTGRGCRAGAGEGPVVAASVALAAKWGSEPRRRDWVGAVDPGAEVKPYAATGSSLPPTDGTNWDGLRRLWVIASESATIGRRQREFVVDRHRRAPPGAPRGHAGQARRAARIARRAARHADRLRRLPFARQFRLNCSG